MKTKKLSATCLGIALLIAILSFHACNISQSQKEPQVMKSLILYYSQTGATRAVAEELQRQLGADIDSIVAVNPYEGNFQETIERCQKEMQADSLPAIQTLTRDLSAYDTIYLGYPVWFGTYARPVITLVRQETFQGKTIIPFCTFGSGGLNTTQESLQADLPQATILPGYGVRNARLAAMPQELTRFLIENGHLQGEITPLPEFTEQQPVGEQEKAIFDEACGDYQFPLGQPLTYGSRPLAEGTEYKFVVQSKSFDGQDATSIIYVVKVADTKAEFTQVLR